jgi:lipopolysaccharide biosynthesis protein
MNKSTVKPLAIYLPQYHPIPENDAAWGEGFTDWTNVKKARPLFEGHYQPHIPHDDIGYYDLRDPEVLVRQAAMAKEYGVYGFAFYHYWFNGKRLLETPLDNMLQTKKPDFPFLFIWANENWTRRWDGSDDEIIIKQNYSYEDDLIHIKYLCEHVFKDKRYIKIDNKPVFIIYRTELFTDIEKTVTIWRNEVKKYGFDGIYLVRVESFVCNINPNTICFDAAMEFFLSRSVFTHAEFRVGMYKHYNDTVLQYQKFDYNETVANAVARIYDYKIFRCVFPSWDNSARRKNNFTLFSNTSIAAFLYYLSSIFDYTIQHFPEKEQFVFINAWNEWGEGCHIEPDAKNRYDYLEAIQNAFLGTIPIEYCHFLEKDRLLFLLEIEKYKAKIENYKTELENSNAEIENYKTRYINSKYYKIFNLLFDKLKRIKELFR